MRFAISLGQNTVHTMNSSYLQGDVIYGVSAVYLVIVGITGGAFNIIAFVKAINVSYQYKNERKIWLVLYRCLLNNILMSESKHWILCQARKTELHLILMNLIVSDLAIIFIGIPVDAMGAFTKGEALDAFLCPSVAFVHTIFGS